MRQVEMSIDIYNQVKGENNRYRVYLDDCLITERNYVWDNTQEFIREHLFVELEPGTHFISVKSVLEKNDPTSIKLGGRFSIKRMEVDGKNTWLHGRSFNLE
jgi:hypothetical protein